MSGNIGRLRAVVVKTHTWARLTCLTSDNAAAAQLGSSIHSEVPWLSDGLLLFIRQIVMHSFNGSTNKSIFIVLNLYNYWAKQLCYSRYGSDAMLAFQHRVKHVQNCFCYPAIFAKRRRPTPRSRKVKIGLVLFVVPVSNPGLGFFFNLVSL